MKNYLLSFLMLGVTISLCNAQIPVLWGLTAYGGAYGMGTLFVKTAAGQLIDVYDFGNQLDGATPTGSLIQASDSLLYGFTSVGGANGKGIIFSYDISKGVETDVHDFGINTDGTYPSGSLIQINDSVLYGTTLQGGTGNYGVIFKYNILSKTEQVVYNFQGTPDGELTQVSDSVLYAMTFDGGLYGSGTIFSYNILTGKETDKHDFGSGTDGQNPTGSMLLASNGLLYGMTITGGIDYGIIFSFNIKTNTEKVVHSFGNNSDGQYPFGDLIQASNGLLYGMTADGGANFYGTIFSYNILADTEIDMYDFTGASGYNPYGDLLENDSVTTGVNQLSVNSEQLSVYPNPAGSFFNVAVTLKQTADLQLRMVNILGQTVWGVDAGEVSSYQNGISVADLADGVYLLEMMTGGGMETREVVVAR